MKEINVAVIKAFAQGASGGNPAGVVLDAGSLNKDQRQAIATNLGVSETAFLDKDETGRYRLQFFTPNQQIENCGHATVTAMGLLRQRGLVKENALTVSIANRDVAIQFEGDHVIMEQRAPQFEALAPATFAAVLASLGLGASDLLPEFPAQVVSTGNRFVLLGLREVNRLAGLIPNFAAVTTLSRELDAIGYYVFCLQEGADLATTRMFAPSYGIEEESATGMAAGPLAALLTKQLKDVPPAFSVEQGRFMKTPSLSRLYVRVLRDTNGDMQNIRVGGQIHAGSSLNLPL